MLGENDMFLRQITLSLPFKVFLDITTTEKGVLSWEGVCGARVCELSAEITQHEDGPKKVNLNFSGLEVKPLSHEMVVSFSFSEGPARFCRDGMEMEGTGVPGNSGTSAGEGSSLGDVSCSKHSGERHVEKSALFTKTSLSSHGGGSVSAPCIESEHDAVLNDCHSDHDASNDNVTEKEADAIDKSIQVSFEQIIQQTESKPPGRKRGRPRKSDQVSGSKNKADPPLILPPSQPGKKYSLRGVKLSPSILGIDKSDNEEDAPMQEEEEEDPLDPEFKVVVSRGEDDAEVIVHSEANEKGDSNDTISEEKKLQFHERRKAVRVSSTGNGVKRRPKRRRIDMGNAPRYKRRKRNSDKAAMCRYCERKFCDYTGVDSHVKKFHQNEKTVAEYLETLKALKPMKCKICGEMLPDRFQLQYHEDKMHFKASSVSCHKCGKVFKNMLYLRSHIRSVHTIQGNAHLCHLCPASFKWHITLKQHIEEIHEGIKRAVCKVCDKKFYRVSQLNRHMRIHKKEDSNIICQTCGKVFAFEANLQRHVKSVHEPRVEEFHCSFCGKGFSQKSGMISHVEKVHFNMYTFVCSICKTGFARGKLLEEHMASQHNQTDFKVADSRRQRFKYHRTQDDLFYCSCCSSHFYYKAKLVEHMYLSHADFFPHTCDLCKQGFLERGFLVTHRQKAHGIAPSGEDMLLAQTSAKVSRVAVPSMPLTPEAFQLQTVDVLANEKYLQVDEGGEPKAGETLESDPLEGTIKVDLAPATVLMRVTNNEDGTVHLIVEPSGDQEQAMNVEQLVAAYQQTFMPGGVQTIHIVNSDDQMPIEQTVTSEEAVDTVEVVETVDSGVLKLQSGGLADGVNCVASTEVIELAAAGVEAQGVPMVEAVDCCKAGSAAALPSMCPGEED